MSENNNGNPNNGDVPSTNTDEQQQQQQPPTKLGRRFSTAGAVDTGEKAGGGGGGLATPTPTGIYGSSASAMMGGGGGGTPSSVYGNGGGGAGMQTASFSSSHWGGGGGMTPAMDVGGNAGGGGMTPALGGGLFSSLSYGTGVGGGATPTPGGGGSGGGSSMMGGATPTPMQPAFMQGGLGALTPTAYQQASSMGGGGGFTPAMQSADGAGGVSILQQTSTNNNNFPDGGGILQTYKIEERAKALESEHEFRNRYLTDDDILDLLGDALGTVFVPVDPPSSYTPLVSSNGTSAKPNFVAIARAELEEELRAELSLRGGLSAGGLVMMGGFSSGGSSSAAGGGGGGGGAGFTIPESMGDGLPNVKPSDAALFEILLRYHGFEDDASIPATDLPKVLTMRAILKVKNGDTNQRKAGIKFLTTKVDVIGVDVVVPAILLTWEGGYLDLQQKHFIVKLLLRLVYRLSSSSSSSLLSTNQQQRNSAADNEVGDVEEVEAGDAHPLTRYAKQLVACVETLLSEPEPVIRDDGRDLIALLAQYLGLKTIFAAIRDDVTHEDDGVRRHTAKVIAIIGQALGPEHLGHILRPCAASESHLSRHTAVKAIYESCALLQHGLLPVLPDLASILSDLLTDSSNRVKGDAAHALAALADVVAPHGYAALRPLVGVVREFCRHSTGEGKLVTAFLRALGSLIPLMPPADAQRNTRDVMPALVHKFNTPDDEVRRVVLRVVYQCISATGYLGGGGSEATGFLDALFSGFWAQKRAAADPKTYRLLVGTTEEAAARYASSGAAGGGVGGAGLGGGTQGGGGAGEVLSRLVPYIHDEFEPTQAMAVEAAHRIILRCGIVGVPRVLCERLSDSLLAALFADQEGTGRTIIDAIALLVNVSGTLYQPHIFRFIDKLHTRLGSPNHGIRRQAADLAAAVMPAIVIVCQAIPQGKAVMRALYQQLDAAEDASAIVSYVRALRVCLRSLGPIHSDPTPKELLTTMSRTLRNRENAVQFHTVELIEDLAPYCRGGTVANPQHAAWTSLVALHRDVNFSGGVTKKSLTAGGATSSSRSRAAAAAALVATTAATSSTSAGGAGVDDYLLFLPKEAPPATITLEAPMVKAVDLHNIAMGGGLYDLLGSDRRATRRVCARAFGVIAANTGAFSIVGELIDNFTVDKRKVRICTSVALSVIASTCQPFTVIPYLINEYRACESTEACTIVQHTILKTIRFIFEEIGPQGRDYILPLMPLLERAVTTGGGDGSQMRRMAIEAMRAMVNAISASGSIGAVGGKGTSASVISATPHDNGAFCDVVVHMLNFAHPNIVELLAKKAPVVSDERMRLVTVVVQFFESCRAVVGSAVIVQYLLAGLYHPSSKVRDVYWRTYNIVYLASPESLIPSYPSIRDIGPVGAHLDEEEEESDDDHENGRKKNTGAKRPRDGDDLGNDDDGTTAAEAHQQQRLSGLDRVVAEPIRPYRRHEVLYL